MLVAQLHPKGYTVSHTPPQPIMTTAPSPHRQLQWEDGKHDPECHQVLSEHIPSSQQWLNRKLSDMFITIIQCGAGLLQAQIDPQANLWKKQKNLCGLTRQIKDSSVCVCGLYCFWAHCHLSASSTHTLMSVRIKKDFICSLCLAPSWFLRSAFWQG